MKFPFLVGQSLAPVKRYGIKIEFMPYFICLLYQIQIKRHFFSGVNLCLHSNFKGKHHIYAHHLSVPYRQLQLDESRSCNPSGKEDNLIIHGDNLHALKALLPRYANRVKCIYIDPPL